MFAPTPTSPSIPADSAAGQAPAELVEVVAHLSLAVGRVLLLNGADTAQVEEAVIRLAAAYGCEARLLVTYETLVLTIVAGAYFRTKIGHRVPAMNVGMTAVTAVNRLVEDAVRGGLDPAAARLALEAIETRAPEYSRWMVVVALGLTAASLSRLFGGDWAAFGVAWLAGAFGTWVRQELGKRRANPLAIPFLAAGLSGVVGGVAVASGYSATPSLCLVAPGMIIVPGVPLINGLQDMIRNHMTLGISRVGFAMLATAAIALGLFVATVVTGVTIPVDQPSAAIGLPEDAFFSALAALGYAFLFNVPPRLAWACVVCGVVSHATRTLCGHLGVDIIGGTLIGAALAGLLAQIFARWFDAPPVTFAFPGVVAMVPGAYAFRAVMGGLQIAQGAAAAPVLNETLSLSCAVVLMAGAIAVGVAAPVCLFAARPGRPLDDGAVAAVRTETRS